LARTHLTKQAFWQDGVDRLLPLCAQRKAVSRASFFLEHRSNCSPRKLVFVVLQANFQLLDRFVDRVHRVNAMTAEVVGGMLKIFT